MGLQEINYKNRLCKAVFFLSIYGTAAIGLCANTRYLVLHLPTVQSKLTGSGNSALFRLHVREMEPTAVPRLLHHVTGHEDRSTSDFAGQ